MKKLPKEFYKGWSIGYDSGTRILRLLEQRKPKKILDLGSGYSTVLFGLWAKDNGAEVISLEQSQLWLQRTRELLKEYGINTDVKYAPLTMTGDGIFYEYALPGNIDFALIDGPAWTQNGRKAAFYQLYPHLAEDYIVWVDDAYRDKDSWLEWQKHYDIKITHQNPRSITITP